MPSYVQSSLRHANAFTVHTHTQMHAGISHPVIPLPLGRGESGGWGATHIAQVWVDAKARVLREGVNETAHDHDKDGRQRDSPLE